MPTEIHKPTEDICRQIAGDWTDCDASGDYDWQFIGPQKYPHLHAIETVYDKGIVDGYATEEDFMNGEPTHKFAIRVTLEPI